MRSGVVLATEKTKAFVDATGTTVKYVSRPRWTCARRGARTVSGTPVLLAVWSFA